MPALVRSSLLALAILLGALPAAASAASAAPGGAGPLAGRVSGAGVGSRGPVEAAFASHRAQVIGFLPYWSLGSARIRYDVVTTIAYFGVGVTAAGRLARRSANRTPTTGWAGWTSRAMTNVIQRAHRAHVRVVLTVQSFAWTAGQRKVQRAVLGSSRRRDRLARDIVAAIRARRADGVNLDFEPIAKGERLNFVRFVRTLKSKLMAANRRYELTVDTTAEVGNYDVTALTARGAADAVVVMGYDYRIARSKPGAVAPLSRRGYDLRETVAAFRARTSASKIILGLPWYGRAWSVTSKSMSAARANPARYGPSVAASYGVAASLARRYGRHYIASEAVAWTQYRRALCTPRFGCTTVLRKLFFDDARTLGTKLHLVRAARLRGTAIWALGFDGSEGDLWRVYARAFPRR
jgi:spore germination protein YaaH